MIDATTVATVAGASAVTSAAYYTLSRIWPRLHTPLTAAIIAQVVVWVGAFLTSRLTLSSGALWFLNGLVVAAVALGGLHAVVPATSTSERRHHL